MTEVGENIWPDGDRWLCGLSIPWLTHKKPLSGDNLQRYFADQILFLRSFAMMAPVSACLQLRYSVDPGKSKALRCTLFVSTRTRDVCEELLDFLYAAFPRGIPIEAVEEARARLLFGLPVAAGWMLAEIRRAIQPVAQRFLKEGPVHAQGSLITWAWTPTALEGSLFALSQQRAASVLAVNVRPTRLTDADRAVLLRLSARMRDVVEEDNGNLLAQTLYAQYHANLREMHEACIGMRILLASSDLGGPGLAHIVGGDVASGGLGTPGMVSYEVVSPGSKLEREALQAALRLEVGPSPARGCERDVSDLAEKFSHLEANVAFRFPIFAQDLVVSDW